MGTILVIEDHPQVRDMIAESLTLEGHQVHLAADGAQGMKEYRRVRPDLLILDIVMPVQDGIETLRTLVAEQAKVPVIAISGGGQADPAIYLQLAAKLGASRTFTKPVDRKVLLAAVTELLGGEQ